MTASAQILGEIESLPPLPDTVLRLMQVINCRESGMPEVVECIRYDQAVTAEVLRICHSPSMGMPRSIRTLDEAVRYLGMLKVLHIVLSLHTGAMMKGAQPGYQMAAGALWRHSVAVALGAAGLTHRVTDVQRGLAFTGGLLHDIGKVVLQQHVRVEFERIMQTCSDQHVSFSEAELLVLGCSHEEIGAELAVRWQLPDPIVQCIRHHHSPCSIEPADPLVDVVYVADCIALMLGIGAGSDQLLYRTEPKVLDRCGIRQTDLELAGADMMIELRAIEQSFAIVDSSPAPAGARQE